MRLKAWLNIVTLEPSTMMSSSAVVGSNVGSKLKKHFHWNGSAFTFNNLVVMA